MSPRAQQTVEMKLTPSAEVTEQGPRQWKRRVESPKRNAIFSLVLGLVLLKRETKVVKERGAFSS